MDALIGPDSINTVPPATLNALMDHGRVTATLEPGLAAALTQLARLTALVVDLDAIAGKLLDEGVAASVKAFETSMASIAAKRETQFQPTR